jgi:hypothetical protein
MESWREISEAVEMKARSSCTLRNHSLACGSVQLRLSSALVTTHPSLYKTCYLFSPCFCRMGEQRVLQFGAQPHYTVTIVMSRHHGHCLFTSDTGHFKTFQRLFLWTVSTYLATLLQLQLLMCWCAASSCPLATHSVLTPAHTNCASDMNLVWINQAQMLTYSII